MRSPAPQTRANLSRSEHTTCRTADVRIPYWRARGPGQPLSRNFKGQLRGSAQETRGKSAVHGKAEQVSAWPSRSLLFFFTRLFGASGSVRGAKYCRRRFPVCKSPEHADLSSAVVPADVCASACVGDGLSLQGHRRGGVKSTWSEREIELATEGIELWGKNWRKIQAALRGSKTESQVPMRRPDCAHRQEHAWNGISAHDFLVLGGIKLHTKRCASTRP